MLLKKDLSQCKDLRTVEHLAQQFGWYAAAWTPQEPHLICSDEQFTEFAKALGKLAVTQDGENLLYFLALAAETAQERKNRTDRMEMDNISYQKGKHGTAGAKHIFCKEEYDQLAQAS